MLIVSALQLVPQFAGSGHAQISIWDELQGPSYGRGASETRPASTANNFDDLRPDATPWRSDVMLNAMAAAIERYEKIVESGGWPVVPQGRMMREGDDDPRVPILRKRLRISGDMPAKGSYYDSQTFDSELTEGVKRFQKRNGIRETGRIEQSVYPVLNITADQRLAQLKLNYERLRGLMNGIEDRYILVNVPAFQLEAVDKFEVQLRHRVIVGRPGRDTPDLRATVRALNFFPYWRVPDSVATLDLIPRLRKEPGYLAEEGIRVYNGVNGPELDPNTIDWSSPQTASYKFKQDPGEKNALGLLRIDMSNQYGVYMHDTPMKNLFDQRSRAFSAGCVRVKNVFDLADWIAHYEAGWEQPGRVRQQLDTGQQFELKLTRPIPVYFTYITAWAEPSTGVVEFRPDIYGRDGAAMQTSYQHDAEDAPPASAAAALAP
ncbi:L,D-transpeptidase family protein [Hyphomicrobium sp.]|uniref:L,D-transpeptidase family protein n=1 Tax=Hyphomicrobium sp. TaxID=82 RepID=UPI002D77BCFA|nr:L,D-transpeptidase family protein [Hyphomicrobium sp.]HET6390881.1 L,D-transpeptidase family protein [Hyphomicrobium sp.]